MLRLLQIWQRYRTDCAALLCAGFAAWCLLAAANDIGNENQAHHYNTYEKETLFLIIFGRAPIAAAGEIWYFIDKYHDVIFAAITAIATISIAVFTATIWSVNRSQLAHSHKVERAYVSRGGQRNQVFFAMSANNTPIYRTGNDFIFTVNNYGKTPATVYKLSYGFCDETRIPTQPEYITRYRRHRINPSASGLPIFQHEIPQGDTRPVVYGRFHYKTIFDTYHSSGFIYRLLLPGGESVPIRPPTDEYIADCDHGPEDDDAA